jgi:ATP-dependent Lon protease
MAGKRTTLEVPPAKLRWRCDPKLFPFKTTANAAPLDGILGQSRALEAIALGLGVRGPGYNVYVAGLSGTGRLTTVRSMLEALVRGDGPAPPDLVFVHNFRDAARPNVLRLPAGCGKRLEKEMGELVADLQRTVPAIYRSDEFKRRREEIEEKHRARQRELFRALDADLRRENFAVVQAQMGPITRPVVVPLIEGQPVPFEQLETMAADGNFPVEKLTQLREKHFTFRNRLEDALRAARGVEKEMRGELGGLEKAVGLEFVAHLIADVRAHFPGCADVDSYLGEVQTAVLENLGRFQEREEAAPAVFPGMEAAAGGDEFVEFRVNVIVDHAQTRGAPIVIETTPTYRNLFGAIERVQQRTGQWTTDFTKIRAGSLLRASGGYLVVDLLDAVTEPGVYKTLKRTLKSRCLEFESYDPFFLFSASAMKPTSIPVEVKVIAIGDGELYGTLHAHDDEFQKVFKVKADFDSEMDKDDEQVVRYASFVRKIVTDEGLVHFDARGLAALVEEGVRMAGRQTKLTARFSRIADLVREAGHMARAAGARAVSEVHVDAARTAWSRRVSLVDDRLRERITDGTLRIDTAGAVVGQVNGLAVYTLSDHWFGLPARITAQVSMGRAGVVSIEREAKLSGKIHDKGMLILQGFLRARFSQDKPLTLSASVTFEQSYGGIDGDSASSTELYAILSALAGVPLRQDLAVTGSVDQFGSIQPIGGVNEKVEGFHDVCAARGLSGTQGVLVPVQNVPDLMLRKDVVAAVKRGAFRVYAVSTIDEGIELLTGVPAGARGKDGAYPADSINGKVDARLRALAVAIRDFDKPPAKKNDGKNTGEKKNGEE